MKRWMATLLALGLCGCSSSEPTPAVKPPAENSPSPVSVMPERLSPMVDDDGKQANPTAKAEKTEPKPARATPIEKAPPRLSKTGPDVGSNDFPINREAREWMAELGGGDIKQGIAAREKLESLGAELTPQLLHAMRSETPAVRAGAAFGLLGQFDPTNSAIVAAFLKAMEDDNPRVRTIALQAVGQGDAAMLLAATPQLLRMLADEKPQTRAQAVRLLGRLEAGNDEAFERVREVVTNDADRQVRIAAVAAIPALATSKVAAAEALATALEKDQDATIRRHAATQLARLGRDAKPAIARLVTALGDDDERVRAASVDALTAIGPDVVNPLIEALASDNRQRRLGAIVALGNRGAAAKEAVTPLKALLEDSDEAIRRATQGALEAIQ